MYLSNYLFIFVNNKNTELKNLTQIKNIKVIHIKNFLFVQFWIITLNSDFKISLIIMDSSLVGTAQW